MSNSDRNAKVSKVSRLSVTRDQLAEAAENAGVNPEQTSRIWDALSQRASSAPGSSAAQVFWYFGATVVLVAMSWLMAQVATTYGDGSMLALSLAYTGLFAFAGSRLAHQDGLRVPGGLLYSLAVTMTPISVYAIEKMASFHGDSSYGLLGIMAATVLVSFFMTSWTRIAFVSAPGLVAGWIATVTAADLFLHTNSYWDQANTASIAYGVLALAASFALDRRTDEDYSFWGYFIGALAVAAGFTFIDKGEFGYLLYGLGGLASLVGSMLLSRRVFAFTGGAVVLVYIGHLSAIFFAGSALFPLVLSVLGGLTIYLGVLYHRNAARIESTVLSLVPQALKRWLPGDR